MSGNEAFELRNETDWRRGFSNMFRSGLARWFKTKTWWIHCLIWGGISAFIIGAVAFTPTPPPAMELITIAFIITGLFPAVGVIIIMQDAIVGEKREGTAAWVLSKPLTRPAFVLSKVIANSIGVVVTMIIVPFSIVLSIIYITKNSVLVPLGIFEAMGVIFISHFFFLSLTLMLGTFFNGRAPVVGIPLAILFLQQQLIGLVPSLAYVLPWSLVVPLTENTNALTALLITGTPVQSFHLILLSIIALESILFLSIGLFRFNREEF
jgi:ABC-2 type transport system permease protein